MDPICRIAWGFVRGELPTENRRIALMFLARVIGEVWATRKVDDLRSMRLLVVESLDARRAPGAPKVTPVVAADTLGAGIGEHVVVAFGKAARVAALGMDGDFAFEAAIVGIVDDYDVPGAPETWKVRTTRVPSATTKAGG
jgi:ethanolamine utilization protein EutN